MGLDLSSKVGCFIVYGHACLLTACGQAGWLLTLTMHSAAQHPHGFIFWRSDLQAASPAFHLLLLQQPRDSQQHIEAYPGSRAVLHARESKLSQQTMLLWMPSSGTHNVSWAMHDAKKTLDEASMRPHAILLECS